MALIRQSLQSAYQFLQGLHALKKTKGVCPRTNDECGRAVGARTFPPKKNTKRKSSPQRDQQSAGMAGTLFALESRIMFDGAALTTGAEVVQEQVAQDQPAQDQAAGTDVHNADITDLSRNSHEQENFFEGLVTHGSPSETGGQELVFIDIRVEDYQTLMEGIDPAAEVILLDSTRDGIEQIAEALNGRTDVDAIHLIAEGNEAELHLGTAFLTLDSIHGQYAALFMGMEESLSDGADLLIYGCNFGRGEDGLFAIQAIADLTGADIAASTDRTGHVSEYANWNLEVSTGFIESSIVIGQATQDAWEGVLATYTVTNTNDSGAGSLRQAIIDANTNGGTDTIDFSIAGAGPHTITLTSGTLDPISGPVLIDGWSEPDFAGTPVIHLDGSSLGANIDGLTFSGTSDGSTVRGLMITGFTRDGILIQSGADNITVLGNWIGTTGTGSTGVGNGDDGIDIAGSNAIIGGTSVNDRNVITNSGDEGITIVGSGVTGHLIQGNYIGLDPDGSTGGGNTDVGLAIITGSGNTIGGTTAAAQNVISKNFEGIEINTNNNIVQGNYIGTDAGGTLDRGNRSDDGVEVQGSSTGNRIGGTAAGAGNLIAFNALDGVNIVNGSSNSVMGNTIHSNSGLGIDLGTSGVTANDGGDGDSGANNLQNFPVLAQVTSNGSQVHITGTINSTANSYFRVEFFKSTNADSTGYGEGQIYLGFANITTDGSGNGTINTLLTASVATGEFISATATKSDVTFSTFTDTSEFSANVVANGGSFQEGTGGYTGNEDTEIQENNPATSFGNNTSIAIDLDSGGGQTQGLIQFNNIFGTGPGQIPLGSTITSASLTVYVTDPSTAGAQITLHRMLQSWSEASDWDDFPLPTDGIQTDDVEASSTADSTLGSPTTSNAFVTFTGLASRLQSWSDGGTNNGWIIVSNNTNGWDFNSSENGTVSQRPRLTVEYAANTAPTLDDTQSPTLTAENEDAGAPSGAVGTLVSDLVDFPTPSGEVDNVTDPDSGALLGIAVTAADTTNGSWFYSIDNGVGWNALGAVSDTNARLLTADPANTRIYFQPNTDYNGTIASAITFRAWDQTSGTNGSLADASVNGATTAFSTATDTASLTVNAVNDAAIVSNLTGDTLAYTEGDGPLVIEQGDDVVVTDIDSADFDTGSLTVSFTAGSDAAEDILAIRHQGSGAGQIGVSGSNVTYAGTIIGTFTGGSSGVNLVITLNSNADPTATTALIKNITYENTDTDVPTTGSRTVRFTLSDGDGGATIRNATVNVSGQNDVPVAADDRAGLTFDGVDDYVQVGSNLSLEMTSTMTMEAWFQPTSFPSGSSGIILNKEGEYEVAVFPDGSIRWAFANTDPGWAWHNTGHVVPLNEWTHVAVTYDSGTIITYVNGSPVETYNGSGSIGDAHASLDDFRIGGRSNNPTGQYFEGSIGEVRIWNVVRTGGEISTNYDQWLTGGETGLVGNWKFTEGSGTVVTDISSSNNDGTLGGGTPSQEPTWVGYATTADVILNIPVAGVLTNDVDVDTDPLVVSEVNGNAANVGNPIALASGALVTLNGDGSFDYDPNGQFDSLISGEQVFDQFDYTVDDGNGGTDTATVYVTINGVNDAPVLTPAAPSLTTITEDDTSNSGDLVSAIVGASITDVDTGAVEGIAITGLTSGNGTWEYDIGGGWTAVGAVTNTSALLLRSTDSLRFVPDGQNADSATVTYRAWDQTSGTEGTKVDVSTNGTTTAYSTATDTATITVTAVNDAPVITSNGGGPTAAFNRSENITAVTTVTTTDVDSPPDTLQYTKIGGADEALFNLDINTGVLTFIVAPDFEAPGDANTDNVYEVTVQVSDGNGGFDTQALSVTVVDNMGTLTVDTTSDTADGDTSSIAALLADKGFDGLISLREAILATNNTGNDGTEDQINFNIAGAGPHTIQPGSALPDITEAVIIDGTTEPDFGTTPIIEIDGTSAGAGTNGLVIGATGGGSTIRGLVIQNFVQNGLLLQGGNNLIAGNYIGLDADGTTTAGNNTSGTGIQGGIRIESANNTIGGLTAADRNVISGNVFSGIALAGAGATGNQILGNYIGTDAGGTLDRGNTQEGIEIDNADGNTIGGSAAGARNVISGNDSDGIEIDNGDNNIIQGNYIGTDYTGTLDLGNTRDGIDINEDTGDGATGNLIGGTGANEGNVIFGNNIHGIEVRNAPTTDNSILGNRIFGNTLRGIELAGGTEDGFGVTANDAGDGDAGANDLQNYPVLGTADVDSPTQVTIDGTLNSTASSTFRIEFFKNLVSTGEDPSGHGEGETYLGFTSVTTDGSGNASFNLTLNASVTAGEFVTATATEDLGGGNYGSTSEFALNTTAIAENDAPVLTPAAPSLTTITEDETTNSGDLVSGIVGASITDVDTGAVEGIAITGLTSGNGTWQYDIGGGWTAVGAVSDATALLLRATDRLRFVPDGQNADSATVTYRAWDQTSGTEGTKVDVSTNGTTTAYSTATDTATITVTAVNDAPVLTSDGGGPTAALNAAENQTSVTTVTATDVDLPPDTLQYTKIGGADAALFNLDTNTGVLSFVVAPDFEIPGDADMDNVYEVTVQVSDGNGGFDTQAISVTITDGNDAPILTSNGGGATAGVNADENQTGVTTVTATDQDVPADILTYSIVGGADAASFSLDPTSGLLTFILPPDFENPTDSDSNNVYEVIVQVSDGNGGFDTQSISVSITDLLEGTNQVPPLPVPQPDPSPPPDSGQDPVSDPPPATSNSGLGTVPSSAAVFSTGPGRDLLEKVRPGGIHELSQVKHLPVFLRPTAFGGTQDRSESLSLVKPGLGSLFIQQLNSFSDALKETMEDTLEQRSFFTNMIQMSGIAASAGIVVWVVRGLALLASVLATLPAWRHLDPIPILSMDKTEKENWRRRIEAVAELEAREHQGLAKILGTSSPESESSSLANVLPRPTLTGKS